MALNAIHDNVGIGSMSVHGIGPVKRPKTSTEGAARNIPLGGLKCFENRAMLRS